MSAPALHASSELPTPEARIIHEGRGGHVEIEGRRYAIEMTEGGRFCIHFHCGQRRSRRAVHLDVLMALAAAQEPTWWVKTRAPSSAATATLLALVTALATALGAPAPTRAQSWDPARDAHIEAHIPEASQFDALLRRDLLAYFQASGLPTAQRVEVDLLRDGPTQSGMAYPKYYAWVRVLGSEGAQPLLQGAVRLAAIDRQSFEVTHFVAAREIRADGTAAIGGVFPEALHPRIRALAAEAP